MQPMKTAWSTVLVLGVFATCAALVAVAAYDQGSSNSMLQLLILAGLVVGFIDRHVKQQEAVQKIDENTKLTSKTEEKINGRLEDLVRAASQAAYAKGVLDGKDQERQRQAQPK